MSIPEKILGPWFYPEKNIHIIEEALRPKNRESLQEELLQEIARTKNMGCFNIHCLLISCDWFDVRGSRKENLDYDWAYYGGDKIEYWRDGEKIIIDDDRPHAGHIRALSEGCTPIFFFLDLPVYMIPYLKSPKRFVMAVPK